MNREDFIKGFRNAEIKEKEKEKQEIIVLEDKNDNNKSSLEKVNDVLLEQLNKLRNLDLSKEESKLEIVRSNAISNTSKVILQTIGLQMMNENKKYKFLEYK